MITRLCSYVAALLASATLSLGDVIVSYDAEAGNPAGTNATVVIADVDASGMAITSPQSIVFQSFGGSTMYAAIGWNVADSSRYFDFTVDAVVGQSINLTSLDFEDAGSGTGPIEWYVRTSLDGFAADVATGAPTGSRVFNTVPITSSFIAGPITIRIGARNAVTSTGAWRIDNVVLNGFVVPVPEPSSLSLLSVALLAGFGLRRKFRHRA